MGREVRMVPKDWQHPIRESVAKRVWNDWPLRAAAADAILADKLAALRERVRSAQSAAELVAIRKEIDALQRQENVVDLVPQADGCWGEARKLGTGSFSPDADYVPLYGESYREHAEEWEGEFRLYKRGLWLLPDHDTHNGIRGVWWDSYRIEALPEDERGPFASEEEARAAFAAWHGEKHEPAEHMPDWAPEERTHYQMYETCSEGTPISPVMETPEALARWLADNNASAFGDMTASYESWLATVHQGCSIGFVVEGDKAISGPAFVARLEN